jgi:hypothetical protein
MSGRRSRDKGARGEREVADLLRAVFPAVRRRCAGEESQSCQGRDLDGTPGLVVQCQLSDAPTIERKLREAIGASGGDEVPVAFTRRTRGEWLATLRGADLVKLLRRALSSLVKPSNAPTDGADPIVSPDPVQPPHGG